MISILLQVDCSSVAVMMMFEGFMVWFFLACGRWSRCCGLLADDRGDDCQDDGDGFKEKVGADEEQEEIEH